MAILPNHPDIGQIKKDLVEARWQANYYKCQCLRGIASRKKMQDAYESEIWKLKAKHQEEADLLRQEISEMSAKIKLRERQLFGKKSEKGQPSENHKKGKSKHKRGQRAGRRSPAKRSYVHLPVRLDTCELSLEARTCPCCNKPYIDMNTSEDSEVVEIEVQAYIRKVKRAKYKRSCMCASQALILTASKISKLIPKSSLGNSIWVHCLMQKFWHGQPINRIVEELRSQGLAISRGTISSGLLRFLPAARVIYEKIVEKSMADKHWHADETGWKVFETLKGKANNRWFLWVFKSEAASVFVLDPSRSAKVIEDFFSQESEGIISCDRYRAYFCFASKTGNKFQVAYCWAHVRRDFLAIAKDRPEYEKFATDWLEKIRNLYRLNKKRNESLGKSSQKALEAEVKATKQKIDDQLKKEKLADPCRKALKSLVRHWEGLVRFV